jgi:hypothetical protein
MKADCFIVNFTSHEYKGYESKIFSTRASANRWILTNRERIYWSQIVESSPKSNLPRPLVTAVPGEEYEKIEGVLSTYFETGMECLGLILIRDAPAHALNPDYDATKPESELNFKYFRSIDSVEFVASGMILEAGETGRLVLLRDQRFAAADGYRLSFYPKGFTKTEWLELFSSGKVRATLWRLKEIPKVSTGS